MNEETEKTDEKQPDRPWLYKKGESGNPNGRPKGTLSFLPLLKNKLAKVPQGQQLSYAEMMIEVLVKKAIKDEDLATMREILNRIDGSTKR